MKRLLVTLFVVYVSSSLAMHPYGAENLRKQITQEKNHQLIKAVRSGDAAQIQQLLEEGTDVNAQTQMGQSPLLVAVLRGHETVCRMLIHEGADINVRDIHGCDPFSAAVGYPRIRKMLHDRQKQLGDSIILTLGCLRRLKHENYQLGRVLYSNADELLKPHFDLEKNYNLARLAHMRKTCQRDENLGQGGVVRGALILISAGCVIGLLLQILSPQI
jgi:hypothetical protein